MELAKETVEIAQRGTYTSWDDLNVDISSAVRKCLSETHLLCQDELQRIRDVVLGKYTNDFTTRIEVVNETTLNGISRLLSEKPGPVAALNFASAKNPGGGFLNGSQAQEESLARSSALYSSLRKTWDFYEHHRSSESLLYSDAIILSPGCPVFRDDEGNLLAEPHEVTFITCAAPNAGAAKSNRPQELVAIPDVFLRRTEYVLAVAAYSGCSRIVLGAWGCGVFRNDPTVVAAAFAGHLMGKWAGRFERVVFSVLDSSATQGTYEAFRTAFRSKGESETASDRGISPS
jgi:uncharacterized protein (TIGR02452 family)